MSTSTFRLEWARALARPRLFRMNVIIPLVLVGALVLGGAPRVHATLAYVTLFVFFGTFGSAVPLVRDGESGLLRRFALTGMGQGRYLVGRSMAGATLDTAQLSPSLILLGLSGRASEIPLALLVLLLSLLVANVVGLWIAATARSVAESALFASVASLLLLHTSGVFRTPAPGTVGALAVGLSPYTTLHRATLRLSGLDGTSLDLGMLGISAVWCGVTLCLSLLSGPGILRRLS